MAETYAFDECVDAGQLLRCYVCDLFGRGFKEKTNVERRLKDIPFVAVTDAKDTHDRIVSDKNSLGTRRSLSLTVAWLRQQVRGGGLKCRWTDTTNMLTDP